jgi:hypothetical protein
VTLEQIARRFDDGVAAVERIPGWIESVSDAIDDAVEVLRELTKVVEALVAELVERRESA